MNVKICHISTAHTRYDVRIFLKEATSLAELSSLFSVSLLIADDYPDEVRNGVSIKSIGKPKSRIERMFTASKKILKKAKKEDADIYHIHDPELFWLIIPLKAAKKKVIFDLHEDLPAQILSKPYLNSISRKLLYWVAKLYEGFLFNKADYIVTATPFICDINRKRNQNIICVSNFPIQAEFRNDATVDLNLKELSVCYTGGISTIRGVGFLIDSVLQSDSDWILHLAGPIGDRLIEEKLNDALSKTNRIKYWGNVDRVTLKKIFSISRAGFVTFLPVPNHTNAVPNKLFEYMSSGLPVICSSFKYWEEIISENNVGLVVDPSNISEIIRSVEYIMKNKDEAIEWGRNGVLAVKNKYNWEAEREKLINVYKRF